MSLFKKGILGLLILLALAVIPVHAQEESYMDKFFSSTVDESNGICDAGEDFRYEDCVVSSETFSSGELFEQAWIARYLFFALILLLFLEHAAVFPVTVALFTLFIYNGSFSINQTGVQNTACTVTNLGYCVFPQNPVLGWVIVAIVGYTIHRYISKQ